MKRALSPELSGKLAKFYSLTGAQPPKDSPTANATESVRGFRAEVAGAKGVLYLYGPIESFDWFDDVVSAAAVKRWLDENQNVSEVELHINSPGGSVFEGIAIYQLLGQHPATKTCIIDAVAASAASAVAMAGDEILMPASSVLMIHGVSTITRGGVREHEDAIGALQAATEALREIYMARTGKSEADVDALMGRDTWLTAKQAVAEGFADRVIPAKSVKPPLAPSAFALIYPHSDARQIAACFAEEVPITQPEAVAEGVTNAPPKGPQKREDPMDPKDTLLFAKLGVSDETAALVAIDGLNAEHTLLASLLTSLGASPLDAEGKLLAIMAAAERLPKVEAELAAKVQAESKRRRDELIAQAKRERKITTERMMAWALNETDCPLNVLEAFVQNASPNVPMQPIRQPMTESTSGAGTWNGKTYEQMSNMEKDDLWRKDPALFNELREQHLAQARR